jgi:hypothetical protein
LGIDGEAGVAGGAVGKHAGSACFAIKHKELKGFTSADVLAEEHQIGMRGYEFPTSDRFAAEGDLLAGTHGLLHEMELGRGGEAGGNKDPTIFGSDICQDSRAGVEVLIEPFPESIRDRGNA